MNNELIFELCKANEEKVTNEVVKILENRGFKVIRPAKEVKDEYTFDNAWNLYQKKVGCKDKLRKKWNSMNFSERRAATIFIPFYVMSTPDKQYRKNFQTFLNQRGWEDEIIGAVPPPAVTNEETSSVSQLIAKTKDANSKESHLKKEEEEKNRILGMIELVRKNPDSSAKTTLMYYKRSGRLKELGIDFQF